MFNALLHKADLDRFKALRHNNPPGTQKVVSSIGVVKPFLRALKEVKENGGHTIQKTR